MLPGELLQRNNSASTRERPLELEGPETLPGTSRRTPSPAGSQDRIGTPLRVGLSAWAVRRARIVKALALIFEGSQAWPLEFMGRAPWLPRGTGRSKRPTPPWSSGAASEGSPAESSTRSRTRSGDPPKSMPRRGGGLAPPVEHLREEPGSVSATPGFGPGVSPPRKVSKAD